MKKYLLGRLLTLILVLIGISVITFLLASVSSIDAAEAYVRMHSQSPTQEQIESMRQEMGLNNPLHVQYFDWLKKVLNLDFGKSLRTRNPVYDEFKSSLMPTVVLVIVTLIISTALTVILALLASYFQNGFVDQIIRIVNLIGMSMPNFWLGYILLLIFAVKLKLVPIVSTFSVKDAILPAFTLSIPYVASNVRILRSCLLDNMHQDFVMYARARGLSETKVMVSYVLKNSLAPMVTIFGQSIGYLLAGTAIIESVFSWPGLGSYILKSIMSRDFPVINLYVLFMAFVFVISNLMADLINIMMNPKLKESIGEL
ncbi:ABC transporter permease [Acidaminobacter sp. JC074]|uniref:ABC transporter permease n=1 Tax=Acidaminobacter sp. JC074 TaxID=2530199 RepID=UPI001F0D1797|nr:ABC transporter permease [Acidaminobacter sp. JC074]MCH4891037.1 ABC transporter permease [Acidaminobacter sp. JC074]